jgi:NAD(P)-dependent dehydrogenase (short-subunit alcohol dehydrogenase family)
MVASYSEFKGKVALVTGVGQAKAHNIELWGNGAATARHLALNGAIVIGSDLNAKDAEWTKQRILTECPDARIDLFVANMTNLEEVKKMVAEIVRVHGRIDYLVNNVGVSSPGGPVELAAEVSWNGITECLVIQVTDLANKRDLVAVGLHSSARCQPYLRLSVL